MKEKPLTLEELRAAATVIYMKTLTPTIEHCIPIAKEALEAVVKLRRGDARKSSNA